MAHARIIELSQRFSEVRVLYFVNAIDSLDPPVPDWPANVKVLGALRISRRDRVLAALRFPALPSFAAVRASAARRMIAQQLADPEVTDFFADYSQGLASVPPSGLTRFDFRQHDIVSRLYERKASHAKGLKRLAFIMEAKRARRWEGQVWSRVGNIETLTEEDAREIARRTPGARVRAAPVRGTFEIDMRLRGPATIVPGRIGFWGNMARAENIDAVAHFVRSLLPRIREFQPQAHLWIIGAHPAPEVMALRSAQVHVTGFVEDPGPVFATLDVAVAPLRLGSGVKIKVFETIDAGVPTVVSPVGGEGIAPQPRLWQVATDAEMIDVVARLLRRPPEA